MSRKRSSCSILRIKMASASLICFVVFYLHFVSSVSGSAKGAVGLDSLTFDKVILARNLV